MRLTKKLATERILSIGRFFSTRRSSPRRYASITCPYTSFENSSVMLMLIPFAVDSSIAGKPSGVAGIFTITLGRFSSLKSLDASAIVLFVSLAIVGSTSMLINPSLPLLRS